MILQMHIKICMQKYQLSTSRIQIMKNATSYAKDHNNHSEVFIAKKRRQQKPEQDMEFFSPKISSCLYPFIYFYAIEHLKIIFLRFPNLVLKLLLYVKMWRNYQIFI